MFKFQIQSSLAILLISLIAVSCKKENIDQDGVVINFDCPNSESDIGDPCQDGWGIIDENCNCVEDTDDPEYDCPNISANFGDPCQAGWGIIDENCDCVDTTSSIPGCTDPLACNYDDTATIDDGSCSLVLIVDVTTTADNGSANGTAYLTVTGGTPPYSYMLNGNVFNNPDFLFDFTIENLSSPGYDFAVWDSNSCSTEVSFLEIDYSEWDCPNLSGNIGDWCNPGWPIPNGVIDQDCNCVEN